MLVNYYIIMIEVTINVSELGDKMLRLSALAARRVGPRVDRLVGVRHASSGGGGGGAGKAVAGTLLFSVGVGGGVVGYAAFDPEFRKTLEDSVPGSEDVLNAVLGSKEPPPKPKPVPSKLRQVAKDFLMTTYFDLQIIFYATLCMSPSI